MLLMCDSVACLMSDPVLGRLLLSHSQTVTDAGTTMAEGNYFAVPLRWGVSIQCVICLAFRCSLSHDSDAYMLSPYLKSDRV